MVVGTTRQAGERIRAAHRAAPYAVHDTSTTETAAEKGHSASAGTLKTDALREAITKLATIGKCALQTVE